MQALGVDIARRVREQALLRQRALDERGDIGVVVADAADAIGDADFARELDDGGCDITVGGTEEAAVRSSRPLVAVTTWGEDFGLVVGVPRRVVIDTFDDGAWGEVELEAGVTYEVAARSASGDVGWAIGSDEDVDDGAEAEDGGGGVFDLDAVETFTPTQGGTYWLDVYEYDDGAAEVEIEVREV